MKFKDIRQGDAAEFLFDAMMVQSGHTVCRPIHAGTVYDRVVDTGDRMWKVQIKSTSVQFQPHRGNERYKVNTTSRGNSPYRKEDVDIFAIYIQPLKEWYLVLPEEAKKCVYIVPGGRFESRKNDWGLFNGSKKED